MSLSISKSRYKFYWLSAALVLIILLVFRISHNTSPINKEELLLEVTIDGDKAKVQQLIAEGVNPNYQGAAYGSALLYASGNGHLEIVKFLIEKGASIDIQNGLGSTPLMAAATRGHNEVAQLLLDKGANLYLKDAAGENAYKIALRYDQLTTAALIAKFCPNQKCD